jgi:hypothetical protein
MTSRLHDLIRRQLAASAPAGVTALGRALQQRFGSHAQALLFYGSCRRTGDDADGIVDLYVLVDDYRSTHRHLLPALGNYLLAPNVYYLEIGFAGRVVRAKYAIVSLAQFERANERWFHSYFWARFAQPCGLLYAADEAVERRVAHALGNAVVRFARAVLPLLPAEFNASTLWTEGLVRTYAAELRSERTERVRALYSAAATDYEELTSAVGEELGWLRVGAGRFANPASAIDRAWAVPGWTVRRLQGKLLSVLRLLKAAFTFDGGADYIAWKIERHSGVKVEPTAGMRRFPRLGALAAIWRTWRQDGFR